MNDPLIGHERFLIRVPEASFVLMGTSSTLRLYMLLSYWKHSFFRSFIIPKVCNSVTQISHTSGFIIPNVDYSEGSYFRKRTGSFFLLGNTNLRGFKPFKWRTFGITNLRDYERSKKTTWHRYFYVHCLKCLIRKYFFSPTLSNQEKDARIIIGLFWEPEARKIFCEVRNKKEQGFYYRRQ